MAGGDADRLTEGRFEALITALGPFERQPRIAVAVSGGPDSLALVLLADQWVRGRGGYCVALTVDHGLRAESRQETEKLAGWLHGYGIDHVVLTWHHGDCPRPTGDIQAAARIARYSLLAAYCRDAGIFHLLTAHHADDQAETFLLRLGRGSGLYGLSAMAPVREEPAYRLLRPLLTVPGAALRAYLRSRGQPWIEDPSNQNPAYARARLRALGLINPTGHGPTNPDPASLSLRSVGLTRERLVATARHLGRVRVLNETLCAQHLARTVALHPAGFALVAMPQFLVAPDEIYTRCLAALIALVGGASYPPRYERLVGLATACRDGWPTLKRRTLGGCCLVPWRGRLLIYREPVGLPPPVPCAAGMWDRRFRIGGTGVTGTGVTGMGAGVMVGPLGADGVRLVRPTLARDKAAAIPTSVRPTLAAVWCDDRLIAVPHLGWGTDLGVKIGWVPQKPLTDCGFMVV